MAKNCKISESEINAQYEYMQRVASLVAANGPKAHVRTYGCQQNEADSERIAGMIAQMGYFLTENAEEADMIIINTCAVREHAELKALSVTGQFKHLKEKNRSLIIGMCGCMVSQEHRKEDIKKKYPYVDFIFGTSMLYRFPEILYTCLTKGKRAFYLDAESEGNIAEGLPIKRESAFRAWVSVMYGCNNFCTYCVVPYVRGRERSREREVILSEIRALAENGYKEITLLGQNVNSYGRDLYKNEYDFADLLADICKIEGDYVIRFMTSHPKDASIKLIDTMASNPKIAKQFHLPLQSGSNRILKAMNRVYTREKYLELVEYMRYRMSDIAITTDIIVGFPGESEEDFANTLDMLERVEYDNIFSFLFSPRKGTPASLMENQILPEVKNERFERLLALQNGISNRRNQAYVNTVQKVLVEGKSKTDITKLTGRNEKNRLIHFEGEDSLIGNYVNVLVERAETYALYGKLVNDKH